MMPRLWSALVVMMMMLGCGSLDSTARQVATADEASSTTIATTSTTAPGDASDLVINRIPDQGDIIELPGVGVAGTIRRVDRCIMLEREDTLYGLLLPEAAEVAVVLDELVLSGPDGRSYREGDMVFFGGLAWGEAGAYVAMSEEAGLLNEVECGGPYAGWPYWSESCQIEELDDILDC